MDLKHILRRTIMSHRLYIILDKKMAEKIMLKISIALQLLYGLETVSVKCSFTSDMTAVSMIMDLKHRFSWH